MPSTTPISKNGETIAGMYEAFGRGDIEHVLAQIAPDVEWIETEDTTMPINGTFSSPAEVLQNVFAKVPEHFESFELNPELWIESGDDVVVTGRVRARTRSGTDLDAPYAHVFSFRDGKVRRNDNFHDTAMWVAALTATPASAGAS